MDATTFMPQKQTALEDLVTGFLTSQKENSQSKPKTVSIGGHEILDVTPRSGMELFAKNMEPLARMVSMNAQKQKRDNFIKNVHDIMSQGANSQDGVNNKIESLMKLKAAHGGQDYGLGVDDIVKTYQSTTKQTDNGWKPQTMDEAVAFEQSKQLSRNAMSPMLENSKNKRLETLIDTIETGNITRGNIVDAFQSAQRIQGGFIGKLGRNWSKNFNSNDPALQDWQKVKMVLTDAQLLNTAKTKGAISDQEMRLFANAAANDDTASIQSIMPVFRKLMNFLNAEEDFRVKTYKKLYGEDPYSYDGIMSNIEDFRNMKFAAPQLRQGKPSATPAVPANKSVTTKAGSSQVDSLLDELGL
jgi:hypothetical protein